MKGDINLNISKRFKNTYLLRHQRLKHVFSDQLVQYKVLTCKEACYRRIDVTGAKGSGNSYAKISSHFRSLHPSVTEPCVTRVCNVRDCHGNRHSIPSLSIPSKALL